MRRETRESRRDVSLGLAGQLSEITAMLDRSSTARFSRSANVVYLICPIASPGKRTIDSDARRSHCDIIAEACWIAGSHWAVLQHAMRSLAAPSRHVVATYVVTTGETGGLAHGLQRGSTGRL
jgi:hypothetical protein